MLWLGQTPGFKRGYRTPVEAGYMRVYWHKCVDKWKAYSANPAKLSEREINIEPAMDSAHSPAHTHFNQLVKPEMWADTKLNK